MGEYYNWVNINKKEYIAPCDFGLGSKLYGSVVADNQLLGLKRAFLKYKPEGGLTHAGTGKTVMITFDNRETFVNMPLCRSLALVISYCKYFNVFLRFCVIAENDLKFSLIVVC